MRHSRRAILASTACACVAAALTFGTQAAIASIAVTAPTPAVVQDGHKFYADSQIDQAWKATTSNFAYALPANDSFPQTAPSFFKPDDHEKHLFETGLPMMIAATYYRCAWLEEASGHSAPERATDIARADLYFSIPEVKQNFIGLEDYLDQYRTGAAATSTDPVDYEISVNCGGM